MSRYKLDLNKRMSKLKGEPCNHPISYYNDYIQSIAIPMNDIMWSYSKVIGDKSISFVNFKYVMYNEYFNESVKPFKKE